MLCASKERVIEIRDVTGHPFIFIFAAIYRLFHFGFITA